MAHLTRFKQNKLAKSGEGSVQEWTDPGHGHDATRPNGEEKSPYIALNNGIRPSGQSQGSSLGGTYCLSNLAWATPSLKNSKGAVPSHVESPRFLLADLFWRSPQLCWLLHSSLRPRLLALALISLRLPEMKEAGERHV